VTATTRTIVLRANACWLLLASVAALSMDISAAFFERGPQVAVLRAAPEAAIGFIEAHGLALILGVLFAVAAPRRAWHLTGAAVHALLGGCNLVFWQMFVTSNVLAVGYVTTGLHVAFVALQLLAARSAGEAMRAPQRLAPGAARP
jgi:hypothetical protein